MVKEFFGIGGYQRAAEGFLSWQHLTFVTVLNLIMVIAAFVFGARMRTRSMKERNRVLAIAAIAADVVEIFKVIILCIGSGSPWRWLHELPLFMCSVQLIAMPLAAFSRGRLREASLDFVYILGLVGAVLGTYCAGNNYSCYPVLGIDNVASGITHCLSGFASLYIPLSGMVSMKRCNRGITVGIISGFCVLAYIANFLLDTNYMFLMRGDGTPYDILFNLFNGSPVLYPLAVLGIFWAIIAVYYWAHGVVVSRKTKRCVRAAA